MTTHSRWHDIDTEDGKFQAYLALPHTGKGPGIVLIQEIFGVNQHIREVADQYATDGYLVMAPDIFWRSKPHIELGYADADCRRGIALMEQINLNKTLQELSATVRALRSLPEQSGKIAAVGYCFGGMLAYNMASHGLIDAAVAYYGGGIQNQLDHASQIDIPILFHYAEQDTNIPLSAAYQVKEYFKGHNNAQFYLYPNAYHGFNCAHRATYQQRAAALAHGRTLTFLVEHL
ncbi:dienelactone hydrolase family protein [Candidatus Vallotia cooleyia]|uniref:dienelactone hydrolase family protein n=1 Tax=Candidatus Vallotiella adelgis TaxID=1177211 RepID=UPI001D005A55|nr:dienelactone hydrolase family protein [Candidatus Vallotia cooleyia]UDG82569.1 Carboxymethylenebutenolidase [Candidatus Vallotia cooleyia]